MLFTSLFFFLLYVHVLCFKPSWIHLMTDWLTDRQTETYTSWLIDWFINCITFHRPVINSSFCDKSKGVDINPFPEGDIFHHGMCLHFAFHFNVKDLKSSSSWKWNVQQSTLDGMQKNVLIMQKFQQLTKLIIKPLPVYWTTVKWKGLNHILSYLIE